jgi:hypothetical protein
MESGERDWTPLRFSTRELAPPNRLPALRDLFARAIRLEIEAEPEQPIDWLNPRSLLETDHA